MLQEKTHGLDATRSPLIFTYGKTTKRTRETALWHRLRRARERHTRRRGVTVRRRIENTTAANAVFEGALLPELTERFNVMFSGEPADDREEAAQDCLCQAWLAYSGLPAAIAGKTTAAQLAMRVYSQYRAGGRFLALAGERGPAEDVFPGGWLVD